MKGKEDALNELWKKVTLGVAREQERIDAAFLSGENKDNGSIPRLLRLLGDDAALVRYYALQSLILDLEQKDDVMRERCWKILREDPDEFVRMMAGTCLGNIYFAVKSRRVFAMFVRELKNPKQPWGAKDLIYSALFKLAGRPPLEWPGDSGPRKAFEESDIDWEKVAWLEDQMENP